MQPRELQVIADGFTYLEGPRWHDGALWFVDFYTPQDAFDAGGVGHGGEAGGRVPSGVAGLVSVTSEL